MLETIKERFEAATAYHPNITWKTLENIMTKEDWDKVFIMEETGGEPNVFTNIQEGKILWIDTCQESPKKRDKLCYDEEALNKRKNNKPEGSAIAWCNTHHVQLMDEKLYFQLQELFPMDLKTSSWLLTEKEVRSLGGAIFGDRRFGRVFIYHNGADSYYTGRGFRVYFEVKQ